LHPQQLIQTETQTIVVSSPTCVFLFCCAGPTGRLADKLKGLDNDGLVAPGTILNSGDVTINMQVGTLTCRTMVQQRVYVSHA
jgi:hypothetical protein